MKVLDLFAGTGSATQAFRDKGHEVVSVEINPEECQTPNPIVCDDVTTLAGDPHRYLDDWIPDHIHASPPCQGFSVPSIGKMWLKDAGGPGIHEPKHPTSEKGLFLLAQTLNIIQHYPDATFSIENPTGMMRRIMPEWVGEVVPISYCQYGPLGPVPVMRGSNFVRAQKPTDLWLSDSLKEHFDARRCMNRPPKAEIHEDEFGVWWTCDENGNPCHEKAERGSVAGVQRIKGDSARGMIPFELSNEILIAKEKQMEAES